MINPLFKFKIFFLFLLTISSTPSIAQIPYNKQLVQEANSCRFSQPVAAIKTGYFFFSDSKMREIYDKDGFDIQLCASYPLWNLTGRWTLNAYGAVEYFHRSGKSINEEQHTSLWSVPVNIGLQPAYTINADTQYYFSIGPRYFYIRQHNDTSFVDKNRSGKDLGLFVNTGLKYVLCPRFVIDIFGEYSYAKTHFHTGKSGVYSKNTQVGGFTFGGGLGYKF